MKYTATYGRSLLRFADIRPLCLFGGSLANAAMGKFTESTSAIGDPTFDSGI